MKVTVKYTHKGWFGLCPVYFANLDGEAPDIHPRHWSLEWLMDLSEFIFGLVCWLKSVADPYFEPGWQLQVTGKLNPPKVIEHEFQEF